MKIVLEPIAFVRGGRTDVFDDDWGEVRSELELAEPFASDAIAGIAEFSHLVVVYWFHKVDIATIEFAARHPRGNTAWPKVGIFAQRGRVRPNLLGVSTCRILSVEERRIAVQGLDAVDGTPVLDLKPHMKGFEPRGEVREPEWAGEIMSRYW